MGTAFPDFWSKRALLFLAVSETTKKRLQTLCLARSSMHKKSVTNTFFYHCGCANIWWMEHVYMFFAFLDQLLFVLLLFQNSLHSFWTTSLTISCMGLSENGSIPQPPNDHVREVIINQWTAWWIERQLKTAAVGELRPLVGTLVLCLQSTNWELRTGWQVNKAQRELQGQPSYQVQCR